MLVLRSADLTALTAERAREMAVDYSSADFRQSLATIDAASRDGVRVRHQGDTTIVTEHRDPYSFYWQLDQVSLAFSC